MRMRYVFAHELVISADLRDQLAGQVGTARWIERSTVVVAQSSQPGTKCVHTEPGVHVAHRALPRVRDMCEPVERCLKVVGPSNQVQLHGSAHLFQCSAPGCSIDGLLVEGDRCGCVVAAKWFACTHGPPARMVGSDDAVMRPIASMVSRSGRPAPSRSTRVPRSRTGRRHSGRSLPAHIGPPLRTGRLRWQRHRPPSAASEAVGGGSAGVARQTSRSTDQHGCSRAPLPMLPDCGRSDRDARHPRGLCAAQCACSGLSSARAASRCAHRLRGGRRRNGRAVAERAPAASTDPNHS